MTDKRRKQCVHCPWRVDVDPYDIPNGYCPTKHAALDRTIAKDTHLTGRLNIMVCHETAQLPCVGWMHNQLGEGNNISLRMAVFQGHIDCEYDVVGEQHRMFEDTLPQAERERSK